MLIMISSLRQGQIWAKFFHHVNLLIANQWNVLNKTCHCLLQLVNFPFICSLKLLDLSKK